MTKFAPKFIQLGIIQSIVVGFSLLMLILLVVTGLHLSGLKKFHHYFDTYQQASTLARAIATVDKEISDLQRHILTFSRADRLNNIDEIKGHHRLIIAEINSIVSESAGYNEAVPEKINKMLALVVGLEEEIENLQSQQQSRTEIIYGQLDSVYTELDSLVNELFVYNNKYGRAVAADDLWLIKTDVTNFSVLSTRYFNKHESSVKNKVLSSIREAQDRLKTIQSLPGGNENKEIILRIEDKLKQAKSIFNLAVQADRSYSFLINVVLAGETAEISVLSDSLRIEYLARLEELIVTTDQQISYLQKIAVVSSLLGTIFAIAIALQISRNIRRPLQSITTTFSQLASGEHVSEIPEAERSDEIGRLASAADIFRQTNVRTHQLLAQTEDFSFKLQQREIDLKLAVQKAEAANLAKSQFLANMSHELRTPMNAILGMLSLLKRTGLKPKQADYADKTSSAARLLLSILNDILDLSKAEAGKMELYLIDFNLDSLVADISDILSTYIGAKPVVLLFDIGNDVPRYLFGDPLRLQQILINLGGNAIKFTEQGSVVISVQQNVITEDKVNVTFTIKDSGIGIAPEHQKKIFSGFTQAEGDITRRFGGTGLGLAISKNLVELMGGTLSLQSQVGFGSVFSFSIDIPRLSDSQIETFKLNQRLETQEHTAARLTGLHILLAEDNIINQQIAVEVLEADGAKVSVANNGQEAIEYLIQHSRPDQSSHVDLILMDLQMPVMDGITATQKIRTELKLSTLPIIAMTANAMASDRDACLRAGMNDHIGKPFDAQHLIQIICQYTGQCDVANNQTAAQVAPSPAMSSEERVAPHTQDAICLQDAIARMGGNQSMYLKLLPRFMQQLDELPNRLQTLAAADDMVTFSRELHSLKGSSAMMGASAFSNEIAVIEKLLKHDPQHPDAQQLVAKAFELIAQCSADFAVVAATFAAESA